MKTKRIVIKVGTSTITHDNGKLDLVHIERLVRVISDISNRGTEVILVTSGAIGVGVSSLRLSEKPKDIPGKQAAAAVGQCRLMNIYEKFFSEYGYGVGQILLSGDILEPDKGTENVRNTINRLIGYGVIPIVNENDTVSTEEIQIGDNDTLSAIVAILADADLLVLLSDIDGLFDHDPHKGGAHLIPLVEGVTDDIRAMATGSATNLGTGGMVTKLNAAQMVNGKGIDMLLTNGASPENIYDYLDGKHPGTLFKAGEVK